MYKTGVEVVEGAAVTEVPYKDEMLEVKGVTIRWLSKEGKDAHGGPEFGLRHFTIEPGGEIPIHKHFYLQTMYFESGTFECYAHDPETDELTATQVCGPGEAIHVDAWEPHSMRNVGDTPGTFLCCICNVYEDRGI